MSYEPSFIRDACVFGLVFLAFLGCGFWLGWRVAMSGINARIIRVAGKAHQDGFNQGYSECANHVHDIEQIARRN